MKKMMLVLVLAGFGLTGCNTIKGVGQDITSGAETVQGWF